MHADRDPINMKHTKRDFLSKACVSPRGWTWGGGGGVKIQLFQNMVLSHRSKGQNQLFQNMIIIFTHVAYQIKENYKRSNIVANILPTDPPPLGMGSVGQNSTFTEHCHVAYQINENQEYSYMVARTPQPPPHPPPYPGDGSKFNFLYPATL